MGRHGDDERLINTIHVDLFLLVFTSREFNLSYIVCTNTRRRNLTSIGIKA